MSIDKSEIEELIESDNEDIVFETGSSIESENLIVYSRDWTVETIVSQMDNGNIDLNPQFQRRNVWQDRKKSQLIESYILGYPVPEVVLAEHPFEKKKFIVIDGKQRLITLYGFMSQNQSGIWQKGKLSGLEQLTSLNNYSFLDMKNNPKLSSYVRQLQNADVRCTIISNVKDSSVLYDIFYRLNVGATPLSVQELRQVLYVGPFTEYLIRFTDNISGIHKVLKLSEPDNRFKDVETLLRVLAFKENIGNYRGNLKYFLDDYVNESNISWNKNESHIKSSIGMIDKAIEELALLLDGYEKIGRRSSGSKKSGFDGRFNTVLFEVQIYFTIKLIEMGIKLDKQKFVAELSLLLEDSDFSASISSSTKNISQYSTRYSMYKEMIRKVTQEEIPTPWI